MTIPDTNELTALVATVLREDLKLGDVTLEPTTPLFDGTLGLDSLDALMLVSGTEKRLGIKLPDKKLGKNTLASIEQFVQFIQTECSQASDA